MKGPWFRAWAGGSSFGGSTVTCEMVLARVFLYVTRSLTSREGGVHVVCRPVPGFLLLVPGPSATSGFVALLDRAGRRRVTCCAVQGLRCLREWATATRWACTSLGKLGSELPVGPWSFRWRSPPSLVCLGLPVGPVPVVLSCGRVVVWSCPPVWEAVRVWCPVLEGPLVPVSVPGYDTRAVPRCGERPSCEASRCESLRRGVHPGGAQVVVLLVRREGEGQRGLL